MSKPNRTTRNVVDAAIRWWERRRPVDWTESQHLITPTVNCPSDLEQQLARNVAIWLQVEKGR